jgi:cell division protein FtsB
VCKKDQIVKLGRQVKRRETALQTLEEQNEMLRKQLANLRSPRYLEQRIKELGLSVPQQAQIMRLNEPVAPSARRDTVQQYAARNDRAFAHP